jgi:hypothetical protein
MPQTYANMANSPWTVGWPCMLLGLDLLVARFLFAIEKTLIQEKYT